MNSYHGFFKLNTLNFSHHLILYHHFEVCHLALWGSSSASAISLSQHEPEHGVRYPRSHLIKQNSPTVFVVMSHVIYAIYAILPAIHTFRVFFSVSCWDNLPWLFDGYFGHKFRQFLLFILDKFHLIRCI